MKSTIVFAFLVLVLSCSKFDKKHANDIAVVADGWSGQVIATVDESYAGWDVEIGDADNDGQNEILTTGCPHSRLYMFKKSAQEWTTTRLAENLAQTFPGMGLAVKIVDLNCDGKNEIILGTGQEGVGPAIFYTFQIKNGNLDTLIKSRPEWNSSGYTHNLAPYDLDGDGVLKVISAYCGGGEIIRYDFDKKLESATARKIYHLSGSGEESLIVDVDNDGSVEFITSNSFRKKAAKVEIFEFDDLGELVTPPRIVIDGFDGRGCFYASIIVGDVDNDGSNEMVVGWKEDQKINRGTLLGYRVSDSAEPIYTFAEDDTSLDMSYFEKMMVIADADNDGKNELLVSTRGDNASENIQSYHLGHVFMYKVEEQISKELLVDFDDNYAESSWLDVGDADNDGKNEIALATGKGDRTNEGTSHIYVLEKLDK